MYIDTMSLYSLSLSESAFAYKKQNQILLDLGWFKKNKPGILDREVLKH